MRKPRKEIPLFDLGSIQQKVGQHKGVINNLEWSPDGKKLATSCADQNIYLWNATNGKAIGKRDGHSDTVNVIKWAPDGKLLASASRDKKIFVWDIRKRPTFTLLEGHEKSVEAVLWSDKEDFLTSISRDKTIRKWDIHKGVCLKKIKWNPNKFFNSTLSYDGKRVAFLTEGNSIRIFDLIASKFILEFDGHDHDILDLAWSPCGKMLASASRDKTIRVWDIKIGALKYILKGHYHTVYKVIWSPNGKRLASSSADETVRLWDAETGKLANILEGHKNTISCLSYSFDGNLLASKSWDKSIRIWSSKNWDTIGILKEKASGGNWFHGIVFSPKNLILAALGEEDTIIRLIDLKHYDKTSTNTIHYINPKIVLIGDKGVGKTGLAIRVAEKTFRLTEPTHGAKCYQIPITKDIPGIHENSKLRIELTLWDLAGQMDYRIIHQLFLDDVDIAFLLFDGSDPYDPFREVHFWAKLLRKRIHKDSLIYLISARSDFCSITVSDEDIKQILTKYDFKEHFNISSKNDIGVDSLMRRVLQDITWDKLPRTTKPHLFKLIEDFILNNRQFSNPMITFQNIQHEVEKNIPQMGSKRSEIETVISLLQARGLVYRLEFTSDLAWILLKPELFYQHASSIILAARKNSSGAGIIGEHELLSGVIDLPGVKRLPSTEEKILLESIVETFIRCDICFRERGLLIFPSQFNVTRPFHENDDLKPEVSYTFSGNIDEIYALLVVRLHYSDHFKLENRWKYAAEFSVNGSILGFMIMPEESGTGFIDVYFSTEVSKNDRILFIRLIEHHLTSKGISIEERIRVYCNSCSKEIENNDAINARIEANKLTIVCQYCDTILPILCNVKERYIEKKIHTRKKRELIDKSRRRVDLELKDFHTEHVQYMQENGDETYILHISDIHMKSKKDARNQLAKLQTDLTKELKINCLNYVVISGDIGYLSTPNEYGAALEFLSPLLSRFGLDSRKVVVVPGNHDVNWQYSEEAYVYLSKSKVKDHPSDTNTISLGEHGILSCDKELYKRRFYNFSHYFYEKLTNGRSYPSNEYEQGIIYEYPEHHILFLSLNSCYAIDHLNHNRSGVSDEALSYSINQLLSKNHDDSWLKIGVWHHPVTYAEAMNADFLEILSVHGFNICMHGHIHEAIECFHKYDKNRGLRVIGTGAFGGTSLQQVPGIPLQYNLLIVKHKARKIVVETRKREKLNGAWSADARWIDKNNPSPRYTFTY